MHRVYKHGDKPRSRRLSACGLQADGGSVRRPMASADERKHDVT